MGSTQSKALLWNGSHVGKDMGREMGLKYFIVKLIFFWTSLSTWQWTSEEVWFGCQEFLATLLPRLLPQELRSPSHANFTKRFPAEKFPAALSFCSPALWTSSSVRSDVFGRAWYWIWHWAFGWGTHASQAGWNCCPQVTTGCYEIGLCSVSA